MVEKLVGDDGDAIAAYGYVTSFFSLSQMVGSLVMGFLLDKVGVRGGFKITFISAALMYALLANATSLNMLFLSKVPGMFMAGFMCAQAAAARLTPPGKSKTRTAAFGRLTFSYTIGSSIGPFIGGILGSSGNYYFGAQLAVAGSLICVVLTHFLPSEVDVDVSKSTDAKSAEVDDIAGTDSEHIKEGQSNSAPTDIHEEKGIASRVYYVLGLVWVLLGTKLISSVANSMYSASRPLVLKNTFGMRESAMGTFMSITSIFVGVFNGFLLDSVTAFFGGHISIVVRNCIIGMAIVFASQAFLMGSMSPIEFGLPMYITTTMVLTIFQFVLGTSISCATTAIVPKRLIGTLMGIEHSSFSGARIIGPYIGLYILSNMGMSTLSAICSAIFAAILLMWSIFFRDKGAKES